jgi:hypothetical protein
MAIIAITSKVMDGKLDTYHKQTNKQRKEN